MELTVLYNLFISVGVHKRESPSDKPVVSKSKQYSPVFEATVARGGDQAAIRQRSGNRRVCRLPRAEGGSGARARAPLHPIDGFRSTDLEFPRARGRERNRYSQA